MVSTHCLQRRNLFSATSLTSWLTTHYEDEDDAVDIFGILRLIGHVTTTAAAIFNHYNQVSLHLTNQTRYR